MQLSTTSKVRLLAWISQCGSLLAVDLSPYAIVATVLVHSGLERMTFYDGRGTHHVRNPSRPSPRFSYCKRQKLGWRPGNEASRRLHVHQLRPACSPTSTAACLQSYINCGLPVVLHQLWPACSPTSTAACLQSYINCGLPAVLHQLWPACSPTSTVACLQSYINCSWLVSFPDPPQ